MTNKTKTIIGVVGGVIILGSAGAAIRGNNYNSTSSLSPSSSDVSDELDVSVLLRKKSTVKIAAANIVQDGDNTILVIDYEFYNGEDEAEAFMYNFSDKAYQNGIECGQRTDILMVRVQRYFQTQILPSRRGISFLICRT